MSSSIATEAQRKAFATLCDINRGNTFLIDGETWYRAGCVYRYWNEKVHSVRAVGISRCPDAYAVGVGAGVATESPVGGTLRNVYSQREIGAVVARFEEEDGTATLMVVRPCAREPKFIRDGESGHRFVTEEAAPDSVEVSS